MSNYVSPTITSVGSVESLTAANKVGRRLDMNFSAGTDISQVTLS